MVAHPHGRARIGAGVHEIAPRRDDDGEVELQIQHGTASKVRRRVEAGDGGDHDEVVGLFVHDPSQDEPEEQTRHE
jgi:hypothetical protein